ncbi:MAG: 50S ribosomal protein L6 [Bdellovibrionales bacterium]|jgi:large subunit ribosomal protein L6|nr:50S ribosomal protein L6 [Bdellovibrionales bacterium]
MSRVGKAPVVITNGVQVTITPGNEVTVKGAKTSMTVAMRPEVSAKVENNQIVLTRKDDSQQARALHGLYRALVQNAMTGVTTGFTKSLDLVGVGYRAAVSGKKLELSLGYSHPIHFPIPEGIEVKVEKQTQISVTGASRELVGQVAAKIRGFRPPEPYLGKGVKYSDEKLRRKEGTSAGK